MAELGQRTGAPVRVPQPIPVPLIVPTPAREREPVPVRREPVRREGGSS